MSTHSPVRARRAVASVATLALLAAPLTVVTAGATAAAATDGTTTLLSESFDGGTLGDLVPSGASGTFVDLGDDDKVYQVERADNFDGISTPAGLLEGLEPGTVVTVTAQARIVAGDTDVAARWVTKPSYTWLAGTTLAGEWTTVSGTYTVPAADAQETIYLGTGPYPEPTPPLAFTYQLNDVVVSAAAPVSEPVVVLSNDFETTKDPWGNRGSTTALTDTEVHGGAKSLLVSARSANWAGAEADLTATLAEGTPYTVTAWVKLPDGTAGPSTIKLTAQTNSGGDDSFGTVAEAADVTDEEWVELSGTYTRGPGLTSVKLYFEAADVESAHPDFLVDDVLITGGSSDDYVETDPDFVPGGALNPTTTPVSAARGGINTSALTFDDGPNGAATTALLDFLAENDVTATFCVIGQNVQAPGGADILKRIVADGHTLCNHSTDYASMADLSKQEVADKLKANLAIIRDALGDPEAEVPYFRAPNGAWGQTNQVAVALGMQPLAVDNLIMDWDGAENAGDEAKLTAALREVITSNPGEIVLVHDGGGDRMPGVNAVKTVVAELLADGWTFTLPAGGAAPKGVTLVESDFETNTLEGWTPRDDGNGVPQLDVQDEVAHESTYAVRVSDRKSQGQGLQYDVTDTATPGATYDVSAWVKFEGTPGDMTLSSRTVAGETQAFSNLVQFTGLSSSQWVHLTGTFSMPAFTDAAELYFETAWAQGEAGNTSTFVIDDILVRSTPPSQIEDLTPLKDTVDFPMGVAIDSREMAGTASDLLLKHFNQVTAENYMKVEAWYSGEGVDTFGMHAEAKALLDYARDNDLKVYGHVLAWHSQTPDWFYRDDEGALLGPDAMRQRLRDHIFNVARVISQEYGPFGSDTNPMVAWDVVNEVIDDGTAYADGMRRSTWYQILGESFVDSAFEYAEQAFNHEYASKDAERPVALFINDYNTEQTGKRGRYKALVERLIERDVPIDGVGHQFHVSLSTPVSTLGAALADFDGMKKADGTDLLQAVTELDVSVGSADKAKAIDQGYYYQAAFDTFRDHADDLFSVTVWGLTDGRSWRASNNGKPLLFDDYYKAKYAYYGAAGLDLPAAIRSVDAFAADADGDYSVSSSQWQRLPLQVVGENARFQLRWSPDRLTVFVDVDDASVDDSDEIRLVTSSGTVTLGRDGQGDAEGVATAREGGWTAVVQLPLTGAARGDVVGLDVQVVDGGTTATWNTPSVLGSVTLVEELSFVEVPAATAVPTIDGEVDAAWAGAGTAVTRKVTLGSGGGAVGTFRTLWKDHTLYVLADVADPVIDTTGSDPWTKDSVEIYVDAGNAKNGTYRYDDTQIRIDATGAVSFGAGDEPFQRNRLTSAVVETDTGYRVEAAISLLEYGGLGTFHGLDFQVNDAASGSRHSITNWADPTGAGYQSTAHWGVGKLVEAKVLPPAEVKPTVTTHPASVTVDRGTKVVLRAAATGTPTPTVQWQRRAAGSTSWKAVAGATKTSLSVIVGADNHGASYRAVFTNTAGTATTKAATVKVKPYAPKVTKNPTSVLTSKAGTKVTLSASASGFPTPTVRWQQRGVGYTSWKTIAGATGTSVTLAVPSTAKGIEVRAVFTNSAGSAKTTSALVRKGVAPKVVTAPKSVTAAKDSIATLRIEVTGSPTPTIQWYERRAGSSTWVRLTGATGTKLQVLATKARDGAQYRAYVSNGVGSLTSSAATLTVR